MSNQCDACSNQCDVCANKLICANKDQFRRIQEEFWIMANDKYIGFVEDGCMYFTVSIDCHYFRQGEVF